ncbi:uncharacterized protein LOC132192477 isoform X2 [Neocloeon triangulifer]|uniref:uncharacterized protein LOC132192477 isoform X2 n=1 Tax=Neocloeon triangulifer TaxID=2078957 RepID=UPI00286F24C3|nr:uncharacterized protein LOC132192477 isoform X2 [Neocloeon triangulifer]
MNPPLTPSVAFSEDLLIFRELEKETLKIDRSILQQNENLKRLAKTKERFAAKLEKETVKFAHLDTQLKNTLATNKSVKDNLKGKRQSRQMLEVLVANLERQLHLEKNDMDNKVKGFEQTKKKYEDMWKNYEVVYKSMPHVKDKLKAEEDLRAIEALIEKTARKNDKLDQKIKSREQLADDHWRKVVLQLAKHHKIQRLAAEKMELIRLKDKIRDEIQMMEIEIEKYEIKLKKDETKEKSSQFKLKGLMESLAKKPEQIQMSDEVLIEESQEYLDEEDLDDIDDMSDESTDYDDLENIVNFEQELEMADFETSSPKVTKKSPSAEFNNFKVPNSVPAAIAPTPVREVISEVVSDAPTTVENTKAAPESEQRQEVMQIVEVPMEKVVPVEEITEAPVATNNQITKEPLVAPPPNEEPLVAPPSNEEPLVAPPLNEEPSTGLFPSDVEMTDEVSSQVTEAPQDLQNEQQSLETIAPVVDDLQLPEDKNLEQQTQDEQLSQGTESTTDSVMNLMDDEKRMEFMKRLMATPSVPLGEEDPTGVETQSRSLKSSGTSDNGYLQNFLSLLNGDKNAEASSAATPSIPENPAPQLQAPEPVPLANKNDDVFLRPPPPPPNPAAFGSFGSFFESSAGASGMFADAFGGNSVDKNTQPSQQQNSGFAFNFGDQSSSSTSSFMNLF